MFQNRVKCCCESQVITSLLQVTVVTALAVVVALVVFVVGIVEIVEIFKTRLDVHTAAATTSKLFPTGRCTVLHSLAVVSIIDVGVVVTRSGNPSLISRRMVLVASSVDAAHRFFLVAVVVVVGPIPGLTHLMCKDV